MVNDRKSPPMAIAYKPTALVAGGAGFIGSFLCQSLLLQGCRVIAVDNFITGKEGNIKDCLGNPDFKFFKRDLTRPLRHHDRVDYVFHLAGMEGNRSYPLKYLLVNSQGTKNLLELAKKNEAKFLLASSLGIFSSSAGTETGKGFWGKKSSLLSHEEAKGFAEKLVLEYFHQGLDARLVRFGWVYGPRMSLESDREIARLFKSAFTTSYLEIPASGDQEISPTFISDAIYGLTKAMFTTQTSGEVFTLAGPEKISFFDLAQKTKKLLAKNLEVKFVAQKEEEIKIEAVIKAAQETLGWKAGVGIDEGLKRTVEYFSNLSSVIQAVPTEKEDFGQIKFTDSQPRTTVEKKKKKIHLPAGLLPKMGIGFLTVILLLATLSWPLYLPLFHLWSGGRNFKKAYQSFEQGNLSSFQKLTTQSWQSFQKASQELNQLEGVFGFLGMQKKKEALLETVSLAERAAQIGVYFSQISENAERLTRIIFKGESGEMNELSSQARSLLNSAWEDLGFLEAELENQPQIFGSKLFKLSPLVTKLRQDLPQARKMIVDLVDFLEILPGIVGSEEEKTYLILLQNNMELRPTGGFIGSFILVSFNQGSLKKFEVYDVYSADGQLKGHVEPPPPLKEHLGEANWYLRDSNWDPNFPTSALRAQWFLEKTLGYEVDGVVAVNLNLPQKILAAVGGVEMIDFQENIDAKNLFPKAQEYSEGGFFPGSTQKRDFLGSLSRTLLEEVKNASFSKQTKIAQAIYQSFQEKDLFLSLNERRSMEVVSRLGWEGSLRQLNCLDPSLPCVADYLMIVESNLGVNKANYYLKRNIVLQVKIAQDGLLENNLKISYLNGSLMGDRFAGDYKNYLRIYLPLSSTLTQVKVGGNVLNKEKIDSGISAGKTFFGFLVEVPAEKHETVEVVYQPPFKIKKSEPVDFLMLAQRQSGADPSHFQLQLDLPKGASILGTDPVPEKIDRGIWFETEFSKDLFFQAKIKL